MHPIVDPIVHGFMLGATTGPFCLAVCLPVLLSVTLSEGGERSSSRTWVFLGKFIAGRFIAYLALGIFLGLIGSRSGALTQRVGVFATIVLSLILLGYGMGLRLPHLGLCRVAGSNAGKPFFPLILGVLTGLNVCPPLLLAATYTLQRSISPIFGVFFFLSFFAATTLYILPVGLTGYASRYAVMARFGKIASVAVGIVFLYQGVSALLHLTGTT
ncbi:MAG: sulfite exporter TauE/SafE family protein [Desulfobacterales bacterium]|nr:sulfite exporter TauE/SafE family protein [Desulfobacterales bacterium]